MPGLRITGLVRFTNHLRRRLAEPLDESEAARLRQTVHRLLQEAESICRAADTVPEALPAPSRRAYAWLASLTIDAQPATATAIQRRPGLKLARFKSAVTELINLMADAGDRTAAEEAVAHARASLQRTTAYLAAKGRIPEDLESNQQRLFRRLEVSLEEPWCGRITGRGAAIRQAVASHWPNGSGPPPEPQFLVGGNRLWRFTPPARRTPAALELTDLFLIGDDPGIAETIACYFCAPRRRDRPERALRRHLESAAVATFRTAVESRMAWHEAAARGVVHDLTLMFQELNRRFFNGSLTARGLAWTVRSAFCRTGYYKKETGEIFLSAALDAEDVPRFVVEFVLFHEMLHLEQDLRGELTPGRRVHTKRFREEERRFPNHAEAEAFLQKLASRR